MIKARKRYFFFDIDGTLTLLNPERTIPESTINTLRKLEENGHFIAIATGRSNYMAQGIKDKCGFKNMVSDGGNGVTINNELIHIYGLEIDKVRDLCHELDLKGYTWSVSIDNSRNRYTHSKKYFEKCDSKYMITHLDEDLNIDKIEKVYKMFVDIKKDEESEIKSLKNITYSRFRDNFIIIEQTDKSIGIKYILDYLGADYTDVVVFGDEMNDYKMFLPIWTSIAMGNAVQALKEKADFVTKSVEDDGIEYACKHFGWID